ncbi:MAG: hypothetical protein WCT37_00220 [Patescibacteria group bacterium]|jgi:hypothetical protein
MKDTIMQAALAIGIATIIGGLVYIGRKLQILDDLKETMEKVKHNVKVICDTLSKPKIDFNPQDIQSYSPLKLTTVGEKKIIDIGFADIFRNNSSDFLGFIKSESAGTKYDVEIAAIKSVKVLFDKEYFNPIKSYLYNNPSENVDTLFTTLGVYVRDNYLEQYPEITE